MDTKEQAVDELARGIMRILPGIQSWLDEHQEEYQNWLKAHPSIGAEET